MINLSLTPGIEKSFKEISSTFLETDGHYRFSLGKNYPVGTYPLTPFELGENYGYSAFHRPDEISEVDPTVKSLDSFKAGVLSGIQHALTITPDYGEEQA